MSELLELDRTYRGLPGEVRAREAERLARAIAGEVGVVLGPYFEKYNQPLVEPVAGNVGWQELVRGETPAAGSDYEYKVPGQEVVRPLSVMARLTTSAVVGERSLTLELRDGDGTRYLVTGPNVTLAASQQQAFCWFEQTGTPSWPADDTALAPLPRQFIYPTCSLVLTIGNAQAGDQLDQIRLSVEKFQT